MAKSDFIESEGFKRDLRAAIESGVDVDYAFDGDDEVPYETFDEDYALYNILEVLRKYLN